VYGVGGYGVFWNEHHRKRVKAVVCLRVWGEGGGEGSQTKEERERERVYLYVYVCVCV